MITKTYAHIKAKSLWNVKILALFLIAMAYSPQGIGAEAPTNTSNDPEDLPDIEARHYPVQINQISRSGRIYLVEVTNGEQARPGKIVLFRAAGTRVEEAPPIMAFRILRSYKSDQKFAARWVKKYGGRQTLSVGDSFEGLEKVRDVAPYRPSKIDAELDNQDLLEIEEDLDLPLDEKTKPDVHPLVGPTDEYDAALDADADKSDLSSEPSPPPPSPKPTLSVVDEELSLKRPEKEPEDEFEKISAEEINAYDLDSHWLSVELGQFFNAGSDGLTRSFLGGGARYGLTIGKMLFLETPEYQDSLVLEGGVFFYKILNLAASNDSYSMMPLTGHLRYNLYFSEAFILYFYGGAQNNVLLSAGNAPDTETEALSGIGFAGGAGMFYQVGPGWFLRLHLGIDMLGGGLVLRF